MTLRSQVFKSRDGYRGAQVFKRHGWCVVVTYGGTRQWSDEFDVEEDALRVAIGWAHHDIVPPRRTEAMV